MEKNCIKSHKEVHNGRPDRYYEIDYTIGFKTQLGPLQTVEDYNSHYYDAEHGADPYWDENSYHKKNLQFKCEPYNRE